MPDFKNHWLLAKSSLKYFTVKMLGLDWHTHWSEWEMLVETHPRLLVQAPRGSRKSFFFSLAYPLWRILRGKTEILLVSDSEGQAQKNLREIRQRVESREELAPMRPSTKEMWGIDQASFANGSLISIMGFGTSKRGIHPDLIINDDIESEQNRMSRDDKDRMYYGVITGMALPGTKVFTVGTPLEFGDLLAQLEKNAAYAKWRRPALLNGINQFPDLWKDEWLKVFRRQEMGSINYAREMLLERIDPTTQPFKREYETLYTDLPPRERLMSVSTVCDPAYSENQGDYTAIITNGLTYGNHGYLLKRSRIRRDNPGAVVQELAKHIIEWNPDAVGIKRRKGDAIAFSFDEWRIRNNQWNFKYVELKDTISKTDKSRIGGLVPRWETRSLHVHKGMEDVLTELYEFRLDDSHSHDDMIDAWADCFSPEMSQPNAGKRHVQNASQRDGHALFRVGQVARKEYEKPDVFEPLWKRLDRRIGDEVAA